jgi:hypothetical protein
VGFPNNELQPLLTVVTFNRNVQRRSFTPSEVLLMAQVGFYGIVCPMLIAFELGTLPARRPTLPTGMSL